MANELISIFLSSLIPLLITALFAWINSRNERAKRKWIFEDSKQRIELISAYVASQNLVIDDPNELGTVKKTATEELYKIKASLDNKLKNLEEDNEKSDSFLQRFFLLYKMRTRLASLFRALFFIMLLISALWSIILSSTSFTPESVQKYGLGFSIAIVIIVTLPPVLVALLLRWLAIILDKPANSMEKAESIQ